MNRLLIPTLKSLCLLVAFGPLPLSSSAQDKNADIYGDWKITSFAGTADSFGLTQRQINGLIGKPVVIRPDLFVFNGKACERTTYSRSTEETTNYFRREWQANSAELPLPNPVNIIKTGCNMLYTIRKDHILVAEQSGAFFEAVRVKGVPRGLIKVSKKLRRGLQR